MSTGDPHSSDSIEHAPLSLNILALDDDADFREYITSVLQADGHEVRTAGTPAEFFTLAEQRLPDIVLLDMNMGRDSGEQVLDDIRKRWPRLCVIIVTGYPTLESMRRTLRPGSPTLRGGSSENAQEGLSTGGSGGSAGGAGAGTAGVYDYLAKPFSLQDLRHTLEHAAAAFALGQRPHDRLRHELGKHIRLARTERAWTLKDLSEACGISVSQLSSVERGSHLPSIESLLAIAAALDRKASVWLNAAGL
jgi:CheY-like chemotaxis protein/DNA-binding XRE family transcriptional regulator